MHKKYRRQDRDPESLVVYWPVTSVYHPTNYCSYILAMLQAPVLGVFDSCVSIRMLWMSDGMNVRWAALPVDRAG